jgi:hypothetical protein
MMMPAAVLNAGQMSTHWITHEIPALRQITALKKCSAADRN